MLPALASSSRAPRCVGQHGRLHRELGVHHSAGLCLTSNRRPHRMRGAHPVAHRPHLGAQRGDVARRGARNSRRTASKRGPSAATGAEARPCQRLVLPGPGGVAAAAGW